MEGIPSKSRQFFSGHSELAVALSHAEGAAEESIQKQLLRGPDGRGNLPPQFLITPQPKPDDWVVTHRSRLGRISMNLAHSTALRTSFGGWADEHLYFIRDSQFCTLYPAIHRWLSMVFFSFL